MGTCLTGAASALLLGSAPASAAPLLTLSAVTLSVSTEAARADRPLPPQDLTIRPTVAMTDATSRHRNTIVAISAVPSPMGTPQSDHPSPAGDPHDLTVRRDIVPPRAAAGHPSGGHVVLNDLFPIGSPQATAAGVYAYQQTGDISLQPGDVTVGGMLEDGIHAVTNDGNVLVKAGTVTAGVGDGIEVRAGYGAHGIATVEAGTVTSDGAGITALGGDGVSINVGSVATHSGTEDASLQLGQGIKAVSHGDISITAGDVATTGYWAEGIYALVSAENGAGNGKSATVTINAGTVATTGDRSVGIYVRGSAADPAVSHDIGITAGTITTAGLGADAIHVNNDSANSDTTVKADTITTAGAYAWGVYARTRDGTTTIDAGSVNTTGDHGTGIYVSNEASGPITVNAGKVTTSGTYADGIRAQDFAGAVSVTAGSVTTSGDHSGAIHALSMGNNVSVTATDVKTTGLDARGVYGASYDGSVQIALGSDATGGSSVTYGAGSHAIEAISINGAVSVDAQNAVTHGEHSIGIYAYSYAGPVSITSRLASTDGDFSSGIRAIAAKGDITIDARDISTRGQGSAGILARGLYGDITIAAQTVDTVGNYSIGVSAQTLSGDVAITTTGQVSTSGQAANGIGAVSYQGSTSVSAHQVNTRGDYSDGISVFGGKDVTVNVDQVATEGVAAVAIRANSAAGNVNVNAGTVDTGGVLATGIDVTAYDGKATVVAGSVTTRGPAATGIDVKAAAAEVTVNGSVNTAGDYSRGVRAKAYDGDVAIHNNGQIATAGAIAQGVYGISFSGGDVTIDGGGTVSTLGPRSSAVVAGSTGGNITISQGKVSTLGELSTGVYAGSRGGDGANPAAISIDVADVGTRGTTSRGIMALNDTTGGTIDIDVTGSVSTRREDSIGIYAIAAGGATTIAVGGNVATRGASSDGIYAYGAKTSIAVKGTVSTVGDDARGIVAYGSDGVTVATQAVTTGGDNATGILAESGGDIGITAGSIATSGDQASAIEASGRGYVVVKAGSITVAGAQSGGVRAQSSEGDVVIDIGALTATGERAFGINAQSYAGNVAVSAANVSATGRNSTAVGVTGQSIAITLSGKVDASAAGVFATSYGGDIAIRNNAALTVASDEPYAYGFGGIYAVARGDLVIDGTGSVTTGVHGVKGISGYSMTGGNVTISQSSVATTQDSSGGISGATVARFADGDGSIRVKADSVTTTGVFSSAVLISADTASGDAVVTIGTASTVGDTSRAIGVYAANGAAIANAGTITTQGYYSDAVNLDGRSALATVSGAIATKGDKSLGVGAYGGNGGVKVALAGPVTTTGSYSSAVRVSSPGAVDVAVAGAISTAGFGSSGIEVTEDKRHREIMAGPPAPSSARPRTPGDRSDYRADETPTVSGHITVAANSITTTGQQAHGVMVSTRTGSAEIKTGTVSVSGVGSVGVFAEGRSVSADVGTTNATQGHAVELRGFDKAALTVRGATTGAGDAVVLQGRDVALAVGAGGSITGTGNAVAIDATPHVTQYHQYWGYTPPYFPGQKPVLPEVENPGAGLVSVTNAGTITGGTGYAVLVTHGAATVANKGRVIGAVKFDAMNDMVTNTGLFDAMKDSDFGAGNDRFVNSGVLRIRPDTLAAGAVTFAGLERFENAGGLVDLRNGHVGDTLTLPGTYVGSGNARLGLDVAFAGGMLTGDRFVVQGAATGRTTVQLNSLTAATATLVTRPMALVTVGAGSAADAFVIDPGSAAVGFIQYGLAYNPATSSYDLTAAAGAPVYRLARASEGAQNIWLRSGEAVTGHAAALRDGRWTGTGSGRLWGQTQGGVDTRDGIAHVATANGSVLRYDAGYRQDYYGVQLGRDLITATSDKGGVVAGVTGGYLSSKLRQSGDRLTFDTLNVGGYASVGAGAFFATGLAKYDYHWVHASSRTLGYGDRLNGQSYGVAGEVGVRLGGKAFFAEPVASLAWTRTSLDDLVAFGQTVDFDTADGLRGKAGARIGGRFGIGQDGVGVLYASGQVVHEFAGKDGLRFTSGGVIQTIGNSRLGTYGQATLGLNILTAGKLSGYVEGVGNVGRSYKGGGGRAGIRFAF